jgi:8-oxo-dGTP pyrophosphatase MutT (NUDIX family)
MTDAPSPQDDLEIKPWKQLSTTMALNEPWFPVRKDRIELPSGKVVDDYFVWNSPDIATIVPYTADGKFIICEQYRYAVSKTMYQFPAGGLDKGETPEAAARRELTEETGYISGEIQFLSKSAAYPTKMSGYHYLFLAQNVQLGGTKQDDENEPTIVHFKTAKELIQLIENGEFEVADSLAAALLALRKLGL